MVEQTTRIQVCRDDLLTRPEMYLDVFVAGNSYEARQCAEWLVRSGCRGVKSPDFADLVIFTGGSDVSPYLYGCDEPHSSVRAHKPRDVDDLELYQYCLNNGIAMFGICRGLQFLSVMNGCTLYQDLDGHNTSHLCFDLKGKTVLNKVSSVHHQSVRIPEDLKEKCEVLLYAAKSTKRVVDQKTTMVGKDRDIEAIWFPETACLGVQGHPEYRDFNQFSVWCLEQIEKYIAHNPDFKWDNKLYRVRAELLLERKKKWLTEGTGSWIELDITVPSEETKEIITEGTV